jgi:ribosomal protein S18 acetylase RimI-like enzyme
LKVRTFEKGDYQKVRTLWIDSGLEIRPGDDPEGIARKMKRDRELFLVAEEDGEIIGSVMGAWDGRRGWIYHLGVRPNRHRMGVATHLIKELEARMKKAGIPKVNALIYPWNAVSVEFFTSAGYAVEDMKEAQKWLDGSPAGSSRKHRPRGIVNRKRT